MENATIIKLTPSTDKVGVVSFEEAFGEHSELRGRGRARRQAKKLKRISNRGVRKAARQTLRDKQQESRQTRKDTRKSRKVARKEMAPVEEEVAEEAVAEEQYPQEQEAPREESTQYADPAAEDDNYDQEQDPAAEDDGGEYFDGEGLSDAEGRQNMNPEIKALTQKIVWNKESMRRHGKKRDHIKRLYAEKAKSNASGGTRENLTEYRSAIDGEEMEYQKHEERLSQLEGVLKNKYGNHPHVGRGFKRAESLLQKNKEKKAGEADQKAVKATIVSESLNPEISNERIDIPAGNNLREVDIKSNISGPTEKKGMPLIAKVGIGVAIVAVAYFVAKKYKVI